MRAEATGVTGATVAVCTVTHNSAQHLEGWWQALRALHQQLSEQTSGRTLNVRVIVVDCASSDASVQHLENFQAAGPEGPPLRVVRSETNRGFAGGMNRACADLEPSDQWVLALNPDARPTPESLSFMVEAFDRYAPLEPDGDREFRVGSVTARLVRPGASDEQDSNHDHSDSGSSSAEAAPVLDACGMVWTPSWRHLDRGSGMPDDNRYSVAEEVVAGTGAGTLFKVEALRDVSLSSAQAHPEPAGEATNPHFFDEDFHSFREDAELGLRLQRRNWRCVYEPRAVIEHRRFNLPERRGEMSAFVNYHSLKNRYLLRILHQRPGNVLLTLPALLRDLAIFPYVLLRERTSLAAYSWIFRNRQRLLARRCWLEQRQTIPAAHLDRWFREAARPLRLKLASTAAQHSHSSQPSQSTSTTS